MKIAVIHEWLVVEAGAEKVLAEILKIFPEADLFCLLDFLPENQRGFIGHRITKTSFIQNLPMAKDKYRFYLPLMPLAIEQFDLSSYDLVISSNYAVAKGVITGPDQLHISYVHSPMRYAWDLQFQYLKQANLDHGIKSWLTRWILHKMRLWDTRTAHGADHFIANSNFIARRIKKVYGRSSAVINPPVDTDFFTPGPANEKEDFYLTVSRLVPYKRTDILIKAFTKMPEKQLVIIGDGPGKEQLRRLAGKNITMTGHLPGEQVRDYMRRACAFLFAAEEDFGIVPLEAQACGTPVIAYRKGGAQETVIDPFNQKALPATGILFPEQNAESLRKAINQFEQDKNNFTAQACRENALKFASEVFRKKLTDFIDDKYLEFCRDIR